MFHSTYECLDHVKAEEGDAGGGCERRMSRALDAELSRRRSASKPARNRSPFLAYVQLTPVLFVSLLSSRFVFGRFFACCEVVARLVALKLHHEKKTLTSHVPSLFCLPLLCATGNVSRTYRYCLLASPRGCGFCLRHPTCSYDHPRGMGSSCPCRPSPGPSLPYCSSPEKHGCFGGTYHIFRLDRCSGGLQQPFWHLLQPEAHTRAYFRFLPFSLLDHGVGPCRPPICQLWYVQHFEAHQVAVSPHTSARQADSSPIRFTTHPYTDTRAVSLSLSHAQPSG